MSHGRELVRSRYSLDELVNIVNRLVLEDCRAPPEVFNPLYMLEPLDEKELVLRQIKWQLSEGRSLFEFELRQVGRCLSYSGTYQNGSLSNLFLYSKFDKSDLLAMLEFLGGPYLDSCYITELNGQCTLQSQAGHTQVVGTTLEHTAGIISKLVGLFVVAECGEVKAPKKMVETGFLTPMVSKEKPYLFHGVPSQFKNAPPLPF
nr:hypothetical protein [Grapevine virus L]